MKNPVREKPYATYIGYIGIALPHQRQPRVPCPVKHQVAYQTKETFDRFSSGWLTEKKPRHLQTWFFRMRDGGYTLVEFTDTGTRMRHVTHLGRAVIAAKLKWGV